MTIDEAVENSNGFSSDTRVQLTDKIFIALNGDVSNGHEYISQAIDLGAKYIIAQKNYINNNLNLKNFIFVDCTTAAHQYLAQKFRKKFSPLVIGVAGSAGKTSTKSFLASLLSSKNIVYTQKSQNGYLGIPKTFESLTPNTEIAIIEIGIDAPGDMDHHLKIVDPDIALITSIGEEHLNKLKNIEGVWQEEKKIFDYCLDRKKLCFGPKQDAMLFNEYSKKNNVKFSSVEDLHGLIESENHVFLSNLSLAYNVALFLGLSKDLLVSELSKVKIPSGRGTEHVGKNNIIIDDSYNSNPSSLKASIEYCLLESKKRNLPLLLVLGDMLDLGSDSLIHHQKILKFIDSLDVDLKIFFVGELFTESLKDFEFSNKKKIESASFKIINQDLVNALKETYSLILVKGSRGIKLENLVSSLLEN